MRAPNILGLRLNDAQIRNRMHTLSGDCTTYFSLQMGGTHRVVRLRHYFLLVLIISLTP